MKRSVGWVLGAAILLVAPLAACVPPVPPPADAPALPVNCAPRGTNGTSVLCGFVYNGTDGTDGSAQTFTVPRGIAAITVDAWGAQGEASSEPGGQGGLGGHTRGTFAWPAGTALAIRVGGQPAATASAAAGGFNGGGASHAASGGGASDVRVGGDSPASRVVVAGGGGGGGVYSASDNVRGDAYVDLPGGAGGGVTGADGPCLVPSNGSTIHVDGCGGGGSATAGGAAGESDVNCFDAVQIADDPTAGAAATGGDGGFTYCSLYYVPTGQYVVVGASGGGGGGGWFGGGGGRAHAEFSPYALGAAGGGGSGYVAPGATGVVNEGGVHAGHGVVTLAYSRLPLTVSSCRNDGWRNLVNDGGHGFADEPACVAWANAHTTK
jgi:hypothetical protein